jgi:hypothetical protein
MTDIRTAITRAADWLEANPDNHIAFIHAAKPTDDGGYKHVALQQGECFCATGRIMFELGLDFDEEDCGSFNATLHAFNEQLMNLPMGITRVEIESLNDDNLDRSIPNRGNVIKYLRSIVNG